MRSKKKRFLLRLLFVLAAVTFIYYAYQNWFSSPPAMSYITAPVVRGNIEKAVLAAGTLEASQQVSVGAQVSGQIKHLAVKLGEQVKEGQLIAEIDSMTQRNELRNAEAALTTARAELAAQQATLVQTRLNYERQKKMRAADASSRADFDAAEQAYLVAQASIKAQRARIEQAEISADTAKINVGYTRIVAPMSGQVVAVVTKEGQTVNSNQQTPTIIVLAQLDTMTVKAQISEADVIAVRPGQHVYFTILGEPEHRYEATLSSIDPAPDSFISESSPGSGSASGGGAVYYDGIFNVPNPKHELRIGMTAQVHIIGASVKNVLTIPASALGRRDADGSYTVRVLEPDGQVQERHIRTGLDNNISVEVKSGLKEGDQVVVADSSGPSAAVSLGRR